MGYDDYNQYQRPAYSYGSQPACNPCQPKFFVPGQVSYKAIPGSRGLEDQEMYAKAFQDWSLNDPVLSQMPCVNEFFRQGYDTPGFPGFGCGGSGQPGGGYADGGHAGGSHPDVGHANAGYYYDSPPDEAGAHAAFYGSPYVQPFAQNTCAPNNYYNAPPVPYPYGPSAPCAQGAMNNGPKTPEEMEHYLNEQYRMLEIYEKHQKRLEERAERNTGHTNTHGSIGNHGGGHGNGKHLSDADVLVEAMKTSEGFKGFLRSRLQEKSSLFFEGDVDTDGLAQLATEYFSENPEELHGRHLSATEVESACFQYIEHNKDNHWNWDASKTGALAVAGVAGAATFLPIGGWAVLPGLVSAGGIASAIGMKDDFELNKGDMASIH